MYLWNNGSKIEVGWSEAQNSQGGNYNDGGPPERKLKKKKTEAQAEMQCKSAEATRDKLAEGQGGYSLGYGEGCWSASPVKQCGTAMLS